MHSDNYPKSPLQRTCSNLLQRLVNLSIVFIKGRGVPFLGAGVSTNAKSCKFSIEPTVNYMIRQLIEHIIPQLNPTTINEIIHLLSKEPPKKDQKDVDNVMKAAEGQLGKLCNILNQKTSFNHHDVVNILQIDKYAHLNPTPAHYFLAFLARETLVNEIITTNYDCCLEHAISFSTFFRPSVPENQASAPENQKRVVSIYNLNRYREVGARYLFPQNTTSMLRIYKINGCAGHLNGNAAHADNILLTERQLQDMDDRAWARDLLRDRARSRALIFSGFGSDEPQIHFTVLRLLEEFSNTGQPSTNPQNDIWINVYENNLSYSQQQILYEFWRNCNPDQQELNRKIETHILTGKDENTFQALTTQLNTYEAPPPDTSSKLSADQFWGTIFQIVFLALLRRYTRPGTKGWELFQSASFNNTPYLQRNSFFDWIDPAQIGQALLNATFNNPQNLNEIDFNKPAPLETINQIVGYKQNITGTPSQNTTPGIPLCLWLRCLDRIYGHKPEEQPMECYYTPLLCNIDKVLPLLLLYQIFRKYNDISEKSTEFSSAESTAGISPFVTAPPTGSMLSNAPPLLSLRIYKRNVHIIYQAFQTDTLFSSSPENSSAMLTAFTQKQNFSRMPNYHQTFTYRKLSANFEHTTTNRLKIYRVTQIPFFQLIRTHEMIQKLKRQPSEEKSDKRLEYIVFFVSLLSQIKHGIYTQHTRRARLIKVPSSPDADINAEHSENNNP